MSRITTTSDTITIKPGNNVYTALAGLAVVATLLGTAMVLLRINAVLGSLPLMPQ